MSKLGSKKKSSFIMYPVNSTYGIVSLKKHNKSRPAQKNFRDSAHSQRCLLSFSHSRFFSSRLYFISVISVISPFSAASIDLTEAIEMDTLEPALMMGLL